MISETIQKAINDQINAELYSSYLYLSMSAWFEDGNFKGFAKWMKVQTDEEREHAEKLYKFLVDRGGRVTLKAIAAPPVDFKSVQDIFEQSYAHEQKVTALINGIYDMAVKEKDFATQEHLNWFVKEQVEEEASASEMVHQVKLAENKPGNLMYLDRHAAKRGGE